MIGMEVVGAAADAVVTVVVVYGTGMDLHRVVFWFLLGVSRKD